MAKGQELGDYTLHLTSVTVQPGLSGSTVMQANWEGRATGYGTILATASLVGGKNGTFTFYGVIYSDEGERLTSKATGAYETIGVNVWQTETTVYLSDESTIITDGVIDLANRTWGGKFYEVV